MKQYLITHVLHGTQQAFYCDNFKDEYITKDPTMVVYDLVEHKMLVNSLGWTNIEK